MKTPNIETKTFEVKTRVTTEKKEEIEKYAEKAGLTVSAYILMCHEFYMKIGRLSSKSL